MRVFGLNAHVSDILVAGDLRPYSGDSNDSGDVVVGPEIATISATIKRV